MGDVLSSATKAIATARAATGNQGTGQVTTSQLALSQGQPDSTGLPPVGGQGVSTPDQSQGLVQPNVLQMLMGGSGDTSVPNAPNTTNPAAPVTQTDVTQTPNNPYTPYDNNSPANPPTTTDKPQGSSTDNWTPQHHEGTLAKIADFMLMMKGRSPVFRDRVDNANLSDAMQPYRQNPTDANLETVAQRMTKLPDMAEKGVQLHNQLEQDQFYAGTAAERKMIAQQQGMNVVGGMLNAVQNSSNPEQVYSKNLPIIQSQAKAYGLPAPPDKYDPDQITGYVGGSLKPADQERLAIESARENRQNAYEQATLGIEASKLKLQAIQTGISSNNSASEASNASNTTRDVASKMEARNNVQLDKQFGKTALPKAAPWLMTYFAKSGAQPQPGKRYVSPDGSAAVANIKGGWYLFSGDGKKLVGTLVPPPGQAASGGSDFQQ